MLSRFMLMLALLFAVPLTACATIPTSPAEVSQLTKADEQAAIGANLAYKAFRLAVETGVEGGLIKGELAGKLRVINQQALTAIIAVDAAYNAANATELRVAIDRANAVVAAGTALLPSRSQ